MEKDAFNPLTPPANRARSPLPWHNRRMAKPAVLAVTRLDPRIAHPGTLLSTKLDENHLISPSAAGDSHNSATRVAKQGKLSSFNQFVGKLKVKTVTRKTFNLAALPGANFCPSFLSSCSEPLPQPLQLHAFRQNPLEFRHSAQLSRNSSYETATAASYTNPTFLLRVSTTALSPPLYNLPIPATGRFMTFNEIAAHGRRLGRNPQ